MDSPSTPRWLPARLASPRLVGGLRAAAPWLGLLLLNALFVLPAVVWQLRRQPLLVLVPSGDLLLVVALCVLTARLRHAAWIRRVAVLWAVLLWLYMWPALIGQVVLRQIPLLYDLLFLAKHVGVLVMDLWSPWRFLALLAALVVVGLVAWLGHRLFAAVVGTLASRPPRRTALVAAAVLLSMLGLSALHDKRHVVGARVEGEMLWTTPAFMHNLKLSYRMYRDIEHGIEDSPYARYDEDYRLARKPDVHLYLVESYGRILFSHPDTIERWQQRMTHYEGRLRGAGWHVVSGFSEAPVSGGGSWMAEATLLTGIRVRYEAVFRHLIDDIANTPNFVRYLKAQGYHTALLAPKDRARPGITLENRYDYDSTVFALDLEYEGPAVGWGIIPDQYSLGYAHEHVFSRVEGPLFTNFHMVSSHAPWSVIPRMVEDWRTLGEVEGEVTEHIDDEPRENLREIRDRLLHYRRFQAPRYAYMGEVDGLQLESFTEAVDYDLDVLVSHIETIEGDSLVIIMGDHQPPLVSDSDETYDVPMHVMARDPALLAEFRAAGFTDGMALDREAYTVLDHEGLFSLLVRSLVRCCGEPGVEPPELLRSGIRIGN
ncbi:alkaline phosphatase family protein [Paraliomyxa miuraensis]|uniref:hypothetical protein n=1 Tax=Paraliomyxa miuraensis TaxID=376150 RepID=UPI0022573B76|nr:hypothetical protein [Paraliomyxa miuraensis]MCX4241731.1 hypothetical protein [Paraliomyxa miuraensis]